MPHTAHTSTPVAQSRSRELRRALAADADLVFLDAPHLLPLWYRPRSGGGGDQGTGNDGGGGVGDVSGGAGGQAASPPPPKLPASAHKRAWLLSPELLALSDGWRAGAAGGGGADAPQWEPLPEGAAGASALERQTEGWRDSLAALEAALAAHAPVDGVLGFSQGASVAAALVALQQLRGDSGGGGNGSGERIQGVGLGGDAPSAAAAAAAAAAAHSTPLSFAILVSGFPSPCPEHQALLAAAGQLRVPSLHVFGGDGARDRSVASALSERLAAAFDPAAGRRTARHGGAHDMPRSRALLAAAREFVAEQRARLCAAQEAEEGKREGDEDGDDPCSE